LVGKGQKVPTQAGGYEKKGKKITEEQQHWCSYVQKRIPDRHWFVISPKLTNFGPTTITL
jgi:hypothetical protein